MATGGGTPKKETIDSISPERISLMIDIINQHPDYRVIANGEFEQMKRVSDFITSTPGVKSKLPPIPTPNIKMDMHTSDIDNTRNNLEQSHAKPRIPIFSGEEKSEVSFEVWKYEVKCIIREGNYSDTILLQSIRGSLKGKARGLLLSVSEDATPLQVIDKLEGVYGNVFSSEALLQQFYSECQQPKQSVAEYGMRLENLIQSAVEKGHISVHAKNEMLRSKFWSGLRDPLLKNASRYKYDTISDFDQLRKEIRAIELDLSNYANTEVESKAQQHVQNTNVQSDKLDELLKSMKDLNKRMCSVEDELKKTKENSQNNKSSNQGHFRGNNRGRWYGNRNNNRNRGGYQNNNQKQSDNLNG